MSANTGNFCIFKMFPLPERIINKLKVPRGDRSTDRSKDLLRLEGRMAAMYATGRNGGIWRVKMVQACVFPVSKKQTIF